MSLALTYAIKDLRGALRSLKIVLLCLVLGVATISAVQLVSRSVLTAIEENGRTILGADLIVRNLYQPVPKAMQDWLVARGATLSETIEMRVMLASAASGDNTLVELKAVDSIYPLYGALETTHGTISPHLDSKSNPHPLPERERELLTSPSPSQGEGRDEGYSSIHPLLADRGVLLDPALETRLNLKVGEQVRLGEMLLTIRGFITHEPDRAGSERFGIAPRVIISGDTMRQTGLLATGSMSYFDLRARLPENANLKQTVDALKAEFPEGNLRITDADNASPQITRFVNRFMLFLTLVGLSALLIGGIGIGNGMRAHFETRMKTIAIFKSLGATLGLIHRIYLWQVLVITLLGTATGLAIGAALPFVAAPALSELLPFTITPTLTAAGLMIPALFGLIIAFLFTLWPLGQAVATPALELFRSSISPMRAAPPAAFKLATVVLALLLALLTIASARDGRFAMWFAVGAMFSLFIFWVMGWVISKLAAKLHIQGKPALKLAVRNLHRPGNATAGTLVSLGLGLTVLVTVTLIEFNLRDGITRNLPSDAPAFFFLDIQGSQKEAFGALLEQQPSAREVKFAANIRGRIVSVNGVPAAQALIDESERWLLQNDRGFTYTSELPAHSTITSGSWWPADYQGPPLVSVVNDVEKGFGVKPGDQITFNILGRDITATIANVREVNWTNFTINFAFTFAPGTLEAAPHSWLATVVADPREEGRIQKVMGAAFPNVSMIRLTDAIEAATGILTSIADAVRVTALVAVATGVLVLASSLAATRTQRLYDTVILKVLGTPSRTLVKAFLLEFSLLGAIAAVISLALGAFISWAILVRMMELTWMFYTLPALLTGLACVLLTLSIGWAVTGRTLAQPAAPYLRNE